MSLSKWKLFPTVFALCLINASQSFATSPGTSQIITAISSRFSKSDVLGMAYPCIGAYEGAREAARGECAELGFDGETNILSTSTIENAKLDTGNSGHLKWIQQGYEIFCKAKATARCAMAADKPKSFQPKCSIVPFQKRGVFTAKTHWRILNVFAEYDPSRIYAKWYQYMDGEFRTYNEAWDYAKLQEAAFGCRLVSRRAPNVR